MNADRITKRIANSACLAITLIVAGAVAGPTIAPEFSKAHDHHRQVAHKTSAMASCYGPGMYGNQTANGTVLKPTTVGVAHKTLRFGTRITFTANRRSLTAQVIDRGPHVKGRAFDLTQAAVRRLGATSCSAWGVRGVAYRIH